MSASFQQVSRRFAALLILALFPLSALARSGSFSVSQNGHLVGTASYQMAASPEGVTSSSVVRVSMQGLQYALSKTERLSAAYQLKHVQLSATVNGSAVSVTARPEDGKLVLSFSANGRPSVSHLDLPAGAVFLPDFDPGALETILTLAAKQNNRSLWAIIPKNAGSVVPIQLATYADENGTLDGKPVVVHHLIATIAGATTDLFSGPSNQLLQAELPQQGFALVRKGFVLTPPKKPIVPPAPSQSPSPDQPQVQAPTP